jgi:hypothetical protein
MVIISLGCASFCYALNTGTHKLINEYIAQKALNGFSLNATLQDQLDMKNGVQEVFNNRKVFELMGDAGVYEDEPPGTIPYVRSVNHFHNPINKQGFSGLSWLLWGGFGWLNGVSSIQWSQEDIGNQSPGGHYSWHDARSYFYNALTKQSDSVRQQNFADTFRGLGQLMHLVEDLSVPEHTRNELHGLPFTYRYENWVEDNLRIDNISQYTPIYFDPSAIGNIKPLASVPVANLFDTNTYTPNNETSPNNPDVTCDVVNGMSKIGLSEYTNANFISPGTAFVPGFLYPNWSSVMQDPISNTANYLRKLGKGESAEGGKVGNGEHLDYFAVSRWGYNLLPSSMRQNGLYLRMNNTVYAEYASHLIPRAVGYASSLLNYFFRGQIDVIPDDAAGSGYVIVNNTDEDMSGKFELFYDNASDQRISVNPDGWTFDIGKKNSGNNKSTNFYFAPPPGAKEPGKYILVFRGKLGNEDDAVVGKIVTQGILVALGGNGVISQPSWTVYRLQPDNGNVIWSVTNAGQAGFAGDAEGSGIDSDGQAVYTATGPNPVLVGIAGVIGKRSISDGSLLWEVTVTGKTAHTLKADKDGVYATLTDDNFNAYSMCVRKMNSKDGSTMWEHNLGYDWGDLYSIAADADSIYVGGHIYDEAGEWQLIPIIVKLDKATGGVLWTQRLPESKWSDYLTVKGLAAKDGKLFDCLQTTDQGNGNYLWRTERRDPLTGNLIWRVDENGNTLYATRPYGVATDGNTVMTSGIVQQSLPLTANVEIIKDAVTGSMIWGGLNDWDYTLGSAYGAGTYFIGGGMDNGPAMVEARGINGTLKWQKPYPDNVIIRNIAFFEK